MKKTFILSAVAVLLLSAVSVVVYVNNDKNQMDDIFRANVEALANGEGSPTGCTGPKYNKTCRCKLGYAPCRDLYGCN